MENTKKNPGLLTGALVGLLLTLPLIAILYLADQLAGLPFVPFDFFDWIARILPGNIITLGIDTMVDIIIAFNLGETSSTAKFLEQVMGIAATLGIGVLLGVLLFALLGRLGRGQYLPLSAGLGALVGVVMAFISAQVNLTATFEPEALRYAWILLAFAVWGLGFGWLYNDLSRLPISSQKPAAQPHTEAAPEVAAGATPTSIKNEAYTLNRREFLVRVGGATATLTVIGAGVGTLLNTNDDTVVTSAAGLNTQQSIAAALEAGLLPNADASVQPAPGTRAEYTPVENHYRIDISSRPPVLDEVEWKMEVNGLVAQPLAYSLAELRENYPPVDYFVTLSCISNRIAGHLISTTRWTGLQMNKLIEEWDLLPEATYLKITSADGFDEYVSLDLIRNDDRVILAYAWDGQPLTRAHGFPLRIWIPDHYGMKQPKWITNIEAVASWDEGYWVRRGWSESALVRTTSVIDTVAVDDAIQENDTTLVPVGGIAYSGDKQISKVEVQVNNGDWVEAQLRQPLSETTWVIWRYDWPFEAGTHTLRVRCYDGSGTLQITETNGTRPDGATGIHSQRATV